MSGHQRRPSSWAISTVAWIVTCGVYGTSVAEAKPQDQRRPRRTPRRSEAPTTRRPAPPPAPPATPFRGPTRIDFDDRLIQGQTNQSGAVYLFDRKETGITSMVRRRKSFRHLTIETIYDR